MNKLKQVFAGDSHAYESSTQKNSSPRNSLDAKSKNDELAARLNGGNSSPRRSGSSATATDKVKEAIPTADQSSHAAQREQPIGSTSSRTGTTGLATGAAGAGATGAALGSHQGDNSYKTDAVRKNDELASGLHHGDRNSISDRSSRDLDNTSSNRHSLTGGHTTGDGPSTLGDRGSSIAGAGTGAGLVGANTGSHSHGIGHTHGNTGLTSDRVGSTTGDVYDQGSTGAATTASPPRLERTGTGRLGKKTSGKGFGTEPHSFGHVADSALHNFDHTKATHDHQHLQHVTHRDVRHVEVEEVLREREHDRHIHHVQHHVQPIIDRVEQDEVHHTNTVPITKVHERHTSTDEDRNLYMSLGANFKDTETHRPKERTIVDLGERVHENIHHHVHHVTQPIVEQEVIDRHRIHTVIPVHHVTHEAPIIHKSSIHESVPLDAFLSGGGKLDSQITAEKTGLLSSGECERSVDGVGAKLFSELGLRDNNGIFNHHSHSHGSTLPTSSSSHGEGYNTNSGLTSGSPSTGLLNKSAVPATAAAGGVAASSHDHSHSHHTHGDGLEHADHNYGKFGTTADPEATKEYR